MINMYDGTEACPMCGMENEYYINPDETIVTQCKHCGYDRVITCTLCDQPFGCNGGNNESFCKRSIQETLRNEKYNK